MTRFSEIDVNFAGGQSRQPWGCDRKGHACHQDPAGLTFCCRKTPACFATPSPLKRSLQAFPGISPFPLSTYFIPLPRIMRPSPDQSCHLRQPTGIFTFQSL